MTESTTIRGHAPRITDAMLEALRTIVASEQRTLTSYGCLQTMDIGDVDDVRAAILDPQRPATDLSDERYSIPDPWNTPGAFASVVKVSRGKRGTVKRALRAGRAPVIGGSTVGNYGRVPTMMAEHALAATRTLAGGLHDGALLAAVTDALYHNEIPALIGSETFSWSQVTPMAIDDVQVVIDQYGSVGISGGVHRRTDSVLGREYRTYDDDPRAWPMSWASGETSIGGMWPTRRRLRSVRLRKGEVGARTVGAVTELIAPGIDIDHAFMGFRAYVRPVSKRGKRARTTQARQARTQVVHLPARVPLPVALSAQLDKLKPGQRVEWEHDGTTGTATMSASGRINVRGAGIIVRSGRSASAVVRAMRKQLAQSA